VSRIRWTPQASTDLDAAYQYISRDSPANARALVIRLFTALDQLESFPQSGRVVPEFGMSELRELIRGSYRLVYRVRGETVELLTIHHASRPLPPDLKTGAV
jgi:plasmid stabilization system protein ParE